MTPLDWIASPAGLVEKNRLPAPRIYRPSEIFFARSSFPTDARRAITGNADETASAKNNESWFDARNPGILSLSFARVGRPQNAEDILLYTSLPQ